MSRVVRDPAAGAGDPANASLDDLPAHPAGAVSGYIAELCTGMIGLAESARLDMLVYLLGMVRLEAELISRRGEARERSGGAAG